MTDTTALQNDLARLAEQDRRLQLPRLDAGLAWTLGCQLREAAAARGLAVTIEIRIAAETVFFHAMQGTAPANADWARRKRNVVELLDQSSYRVGRELLLENSSLEAKMGLPTRDYAPHGGSVPLRVAGTRLGTVTVSGLPQRDDHTLVITLLAPLAGVPLAEIALA
ncbi:MAG TPA: heme-degrading domain-containing protein [Ideonella sp.]|nr:heme-degrading domain-containing protein [Ideonella sp.]